MSNCILQFAVTDKVIEIVPRWALIECLLLYGNVQKETETEKSSTMISWCFQYSIQPSESVNSLQ